MKPSADVDPGALDARTTEYIDRLVDEAPPLSEAQRDVIATVFHGALTKKPARE
jgi:hypothetical protein